MPIPARPIRALAATTAVTVGLLVAQPASAAEYVTDGSFETGLSSPSVWTSTSSNFGTSICDAAACGTGGGPMVPRTGNVFTWFGGTSSAETGSVSQNVTVPAGRPTVLSFWLKASAPHTGTTLKVSIGGVQRWTYAEATDDPVAHPYAAYTRVEIPIPGSAFAGTPTPLRFDFVSPGRASGTINYAVDDVSLVDGSLADARVALSPTTGTARVGDVVTYDVTVANAGPTTADVSVRGTLTPGLEPISSGGSGLTCTPPAGPGAQLVCTAGSLAPGAVVTDRIELRAVAVGTAGLTLTSHVAPPAHDAEPSNDSATATLEVLPVPGPHIDPAPAPDVPAPQPKGTTPPSPVKPTTSEPRTAPACLVERRFVTRLIRGRKGPGLRIPASPSRARIVSARLTGPKRGKTRKVRRTRRNVTVDLRGAPAGRYTLRVRVRVPAAGRGKKPRTVTVTRTYRACR